MDDRNEKTFSLVFSEPSVHLLQSGQPSPSATDASEKPRKPGFLDELIRFLKRLLNCCLSCLTCGCYPRPSDNLAHEVHEADLLEEEREAVQNLLQALRTERKEKPKLTKEYVRSLAVLTYSDNWQLQYSAAGYLYDVSEYDETLSEEVVGLLKTLLRSKNPAARKRASGAVRNFSRGGPESNKGLLMNSGIVQQLVECSEVSHPLYIQSSDFTSGCFTALATQNKYKLMLMHAGVVKPLLYWVQNETNDTTRKNATGCLLNLSHLQQCRDELVSKGALPVLVEALPHFNTEPLVCYYAAAALSNFAVNPRHRAMMVGIGHKDVLTHLIAMLGCSVERVRCQACLALRNLASDGDTQVLIVRLGGLKPLHKIVERTKGETLTAALACLRNLSIHKSNESSIIRETFLSELRKLVKEHTNPDCQVHAAGTVRNLAGGDQIRVIVESGCIESLVFVVLSSKTEVRVLVEATAALAFLCDDDEAKKRLLQVQNGKIFQHLIDLAATCANGDVQYNCAGILGQLSLTEIPEVLVDQCEAKIMSYLHHFLENENESFVHISLWTCLQLLNYPRFQKLFKGHQIVKLLEGIPEKHKNDTIKELAFQVMAKLKELS